MGRDITFGPLSGSLSWVTLDGKTSDFDQIRTSKKEGLKEGPDDWVFRVEVPPNERLHVPKKGGKFKESLPSRPRAAARGPARAYARVHARVRARTRASARVRARALARARGTTRLIVIYAFHI